MNESYRQGLTDAAVAMCYLCKEGYPVRLRGGDTWVHVLLWNDQVTEHYEPCKVSAVQRLLHANEVNNEME